MNSVKAKIKDISRRIVPAGYKQTRLGIIPETWDTPELNTLLTENKTLNRDNLYSRNDVLSVSGEMGVTNQIDLLGRSFAGKSVLEYHVVEHGDVVYTKSPLKANPYGIIKQNKGQAGIVSTLYAVYHPRNYSTGTYLDYYFSLDQNVNNYLRPLVRKGAKNSLEINNDDTLKGTIVFPPENERSKILEVLECCDKVICLKRELIEEKKKQKKSLMQKLMRLRTAQYRNDCLGQNITLISGVDFTPSYYNETNDGTPYLTGASNIEGKEIIINRWTRFPRNIAVKNDIILVCKGAGVGTIAKMNYPQAHIARQLMAIRGGNKMKTDYIYYFLEDSINEIKRKSKGLIEGIDRKTVLELRISVPPIPYQETTIRILSSADHERDLLEQDLTQWEQKKKSLMQLLLTGKVRV